MHLIIRAFFRICASLSLAVLVFCRSEPAEIPGNHPETSRAPGESASPARCLLVEDGFGPAGTVEVRVEEVVTGLEVPWGVAFLPNGDILVTERPGRLRLVRNGQLLPGPVASLQIADTSEGGLLGLALHPDFSSNWFFFLYYTTGKGGAAVNRVERWKLAEDSLTASPDRIILDDIPAATYHNGGRLRIGPDRMLYIGTGDARDPQNSQDRGTLAGKLLRVTPEGDIPEDNPFPGSPVFLMGIRNTQGFDWPNSSTVWLTDHGPSGEMGRRGHDEVSVAAAGANLGWPSIYGCQTAGGVVAPSLSWETAVPPGGAAIYTGNAIPEWKGSLMIGTLGSEHLHRVVLKDSGVESHEVYFRDGNSLGRLREVIMGPAGQLYVTTSNCDGRGDCGPEKDKLLRITR